MFTVEINAGGLIEARVQALKTVDQAHAYARAITQVVQQVAARRYVLCADHRPVVVYPQPVADALAELLVNMNRKLERAALLVAPSNATLTMQLDRLVRQAQNPSRRVFHGADQAKEFLGEVLDPAERKRLAAFLEPRGEAPGAPPAPATSRKPAS